MPNGSFSVFIFPLESLIQDAVAAGIQVMPCCFTCVTGAWRLSVKKRHLSQH